MYVKESEMVGIELLMERKLSLEPRSGLSLMVSNSSSLSSSSSSVCFASDCSASSCLKGSTSLIPLGCSEMTIYHETMGGCGISIQICGNN